MAEGQSLYTTAKLRASFILLETFHKVHSQLQYQPEWCQHLLLAKIKDNTNIICVSNIS